MFIPALFTRISRCPSSPIARSTMRLTCAESLTSAAIPGGRLLESEQIVAHHGEDRAVAADDVVRRDARASIRLPGLLCRVVNDLEGRFHLRDELLHEVGAAVVHGDRNYLEAFRGI